MHRSFLGIPLAEATAKNIYFQNILNSNTAYYTVIYYKNKNQRATSKLSLTAFLLHGTCIAESEVCINVLRMLVEIMEPVIMMTKTQITKMERFNAVRNLQAPDFMPVWPRAMSQLIYSMGWRLTDITGDDWYDSDKCAEAVLWSLQQIDYDIALPAYTDIAFGVNTVGGAVHVPIQFGVSVGTKRDKPIKSKADWRRLQKRFAVIDVARTDLRMQGALATIRKVARSVGGSTPLVATGYLAATAAMLFFRPYEDFIYDMIHESDWVDEMCRLAADWTLDWIRAQYEAGANSVAFVVDTLGTHLISPTMGERFNLPYLCDLVDHVRKEFHQGVWLHIHGNMKTPMGYAYLEKIVKEAKIEGLHLDDSHSPKWIKKNVIEKFHIPACIASDCHKIALGPTASIQEIVKQAMSQIEDGLGMIMAPCCQVLPYTPNEYFKAWVDATHTYGRYPLNSINGGSVRRGG